MKEKVDRIIIGAGIYGLYSALYCAEKGENVIIIEYDSEAMSRASYINQARVHNGYHYPRSYSTAIKSAKYFNRFCKEFDFAIKKKFKKIYATSTTFSWTSADQFKLFCKNANIQCESVHPDKYFNKGTIDGVFETEEYAFDAMLIKDYFLEKLKQYSSVKILYGSRIEGVTNDEVAGLYEIRLESNTTLQSGFILNASYASINQIIDIFCFDKFRIKYEICEITLCKVNKRLSDVGITVMDGPFFSIMPFGLTKYHSLTSVTFTPHVTSYNELPEFECQKGVACSSIQLENCNICPNKPETAWNYMNSLAKKYLKENLIYHYEKSLFSIKPILLTSEIDDSRPTVIKQFSNKPTFVSVLSGKINTLYDLKEVL